MPAKGKQNLDPRIQAIFACAMDYSSWRDEGEEQDSIARVSKLFSLDFKAVEKIRAWWFLEKNTLLNDLEKALVKMAKADGLDSDEIETIEAQFESDVFCADLIMFLGKHLFGEPPTDDDIHFAETIEVNDIDPEDLNPHFAKFLSSSLPVEVARKFFSSTAGSKILELV